MKKEARVRKGRVASTRYVVGGLVTVGANALVQTRDGEIPADHLMAGDDLVARDGGYLRLYHATRLRQEVRTVWVRDGFLPGMAPKGGVLLPSHQPVLRRDLRPVPVPVAALVPLGLAEDIGVRQLTMIQLWLEGVDTVYIGGLELSVMTVGDKPRVAA